MKNFFRKIGYSIAKIEKYPEMATDGVKAAIKYMAIIILGIAIISSILSVHATEQTMQQMATYVEENIPEFQYKDGIVTTEEEQPKRLEGKGLGVNKIIIDVNQESEEEINKYKEEIKQEGTGMLLLKDKAVILSNDQEVAYQYSSIAAQYQQTGELKKADIIKYLRDNNYFNKYAQVAIIYFVTLWITYLAESLLIAVIIAAIGYVVAIILKVRMRYKAIFNMAVYSLTLSIILQTIYIPINYFTGFEISLFEIMYMGVAFIYLIAAIFLTRIDLIKHQEELTKVKEVQKEVREQIEEEKQKEQEEKKENPDNKDEKEKKKEKEDKQDEEGGEPEGSNV